MQQLQHGMRYGLVALVVLVIGALTLAQSGDATRQNPIILETNGVLQVGDDGLLGERIVWVAVLRNTGATITDDLRLTSTIRDELAIDSVIASTGTPVVDGQTVRVPLDGLAADEQVTVRITTTVRAANTIVNQTMCLQRVGVPDQCATSSTIPTTPVNQLPATGENPRWRDTLIVAGLLLAAVALYRALQMGAILDADYR